MELSSKNSINHEKSLCLYCDKAFANNLDQESHVERDHKTILYKGKGSRKSERITKNNSSAENPFPGCFHCNKKTLRTDDLETLFQHLLSSHKDVYFGCKCKIRTQDKVSLVSHKKNCKISGGKSCRGSEENVSDNRKTGKKSQIVKSYGESKCDSVSESEDNDSTATAAATCSKTLPTNAIHTKSDRNKLKNASVNDKARKGKSSSSSTTSSSSNRTGNGEYTIPLTRQKLKEPPGNPKPVATQSRYPSNKKTLKPYKPVGPVESKNITSTSPTTKVHRTKTNKIVNTNSQSLSEPVENIQKTELVTTEFEQDFYKNISHNIRVNLDCYVDGKNDRLKSRPAFDYLSEELSASSTSGEPIHENELHEATHFELSTPFPALLTVEQYGFGDSNPNKHKRKITKNSWKWKWDLIKKYKYVNEGGKIVKKVKQITTGLKDLSQLDMWTQLSMRSRYENLNSQNVGVSDNGLTDCLSTRTIKTQKVEQLNHILDKCLTPEINIEQLQQTVIKLEPEEKEEAKGHLEEETEMNEADVTEPELFNMLNLVKANNPNLSKPLLSGEWARPRCYICLDCGLKFDLMKSLNDHKNSEHPYVVSAHYEIVGRENLEQKLYKNLFLPKKALQASGFARSLSVNSDSKSNETNEASTSSDNSSKFFADQKEKECSKCLKMIKYSSDTDIYKHILDCIEDRVWLQAKRRSKYRRSRRKTRKTPRKSRLSIDQKKLTSSPSTKDNTEGENSTLSSSNPPTPKNDLRASALTSTKIGKSIATLTETKTVNGKTNLCDGMSIKNFFRVSKTTPSLPQKVVVQMFNISTNSPLKSSLRSSSVKRSLNNDILKNGSASSNDKVQEEMTPNESVKLEETSSEISVLNSDVALKQTQREMNTQEADVKDTKSPLIPLDITTPEKDASDSLLSSPSSLSLISPTSNSNVPKKKKKLNDCIAMLTGKIQEKLGVVFFESPVPVPKTEASSVVENPAAVLSSSNVLMEQNISETQPSTSFQIASLLKESAFDSPVQEEVIDLSLKKKPTTTNVEKETLKRNDEFIPPVVNEPRAESCHSSKETKSVFKEPQEQAAEPVLLNQFELKLEPKQLHVQEGCNQSLLKAATVKTSEVEEVKASFKANPKPDEPSSCIAISTSEKVCDSESLKISIPKERIPNLKQILDQYQVITVNNIKISESERRAFEEQKNRILKILNKTNSLTRKITNRKTNFKKAVKRKTSTKRKPPQRNAKKTEIVTTTSEISESKVPEIKVGSVEAKIEEVIKTTNRIRCRRLSVVVDPIINLSAYQNKNRKIRLTNNSQQNGFYDILAASEQFFSENKTLLPSTPEEVLEKAIDEVKTELEAKSSELEMPDAPKEQNEVMDNIVKTKSRTAKINASKEITKIVCTIQKEALAKKSENVSEPKSKAKIFEKVLKSDPPEVKETKPLDEKLQEKSLEAEKVTTAAKKVRGKKQNVENIASPVVVLEPLENVDFKSSKEDCVNSFCDLPKNKQRKPPMKRGKKNAFPLEEIKADQRVEFVTVKGLVDKKKVLRGKLALREENLLDISFSSDTSNENDIPLAKLIPSAGIGSNKTTIDLVPVEPEIIDKTHLIATTNENDLEVEETVKSQQELLLSPIDDNEIKKEQNATSPKEEQRVNINCEEESLIETIVEKQEPFLSKSLSTIDLTAIIQNDSKKSFNPFTINEDSFFNDDLDNDPSDKINDIVNNIINSSEFQIDSDTEKNEVYQESGEEFFGDKKKKMPCCVVCKRSFRTDKVLEKHCTTSTHMMKVQRKHRGNAKTKEREIINLDPDILKESPSPTIDETKVFRTKGALKTFDHIMDISAAAGGDQPKVIEIVNPSELTKVMPKLDLSRDEKLLNANDDKLYYEFKMEKKPEDMTPKDKDQLFDSLFNSLEAKTQEKELSLCSKLSFSVTTPIDSELESSSTSWDFKHDANVKWDCGKTENVPFADAIKEKYPKKFPVKINKSKDTAVSIPTKSLIMGKIFKKHRDSEKQKTPQADAPNNKPLVKNSLDEIFDHLKNSAEIDDKVLTCPSPKTLLKTNGGIFPSNSSHSNEMIETASHSNNNNIYKSKPEQAVPEKAIKLPKKISVATESHTLNDSLIGNGDEGIGKRKSRRRCAIQSKTCAETWSSDEYEELHDTEDIISIINEIEKRESIKKRKMLKQEIHFDQKKTDATNNLKPTLTRKSAEPFPEKKAAAETVLSDKTEKKKATQIQFSDVNSKAEKMSSSTKKRRNSSTKDHQHKSDEEAFTATVRPGIPIKNRRMSCFVPSTTSFDLPTKLKPPVVRPMTDILEVEPEALKRFDKIKKPDSEKSFKNQKKFINLTGNCGGQLATKKKAQKHRKRPRNKVKNIAYDSDSDFELNLSKKTKVSNFSENSSSGQDEDEDNEDNVIITPKTNKSQMTTNTSRSSNTNNMTMIKEPKLLPNDLKHVVTTATTTFKAAIPDDIADSSQNACNRTKRHSSEKLYYWSSSSESDQEQGDIADGDNEDSVMPHQPEQHGWIVGDSHKKLVTLLAHAKIKNKIN